VKLPIDYAAIDARRAALKARVLAFIHEGYALAAEAEKEFKVKIPLELYQYTEKGGDEPDADVYTDAEHSAQDFDLCRVWTGRGNAEECADLGDIGDLAEIEGVTITADDVEWLRWVTTARNQLNYVAAHIENVHCDVFPAEYDAYHAEKDRLAEEAKAQREANKPKPAPVEFDPFHDDN